MAGGNHLEYLVSPVILSSYICVALRSRTRDSYYSGKRYRTRKRRHNVVEKIYVLLLEKQEEGTFFLSVNGIKVILALQASSFIYKMEIIPPTSPGFCVDNTSRGIADRPVNGRQVLSFHTHPFQSLHSRWRGC